MVGVGVPRCFANLFGDLFESPILQGVVAERELGSLNANWGSLNGNGATPGRLPALCPPARAQTPPCTLLACACRHRVCGR